MEGRKGILYMNDLHFWEGSGKVPIWREGMIFLFEGRNPYTRETEAFPYGRGKDNLLCEREEGGDHNMEEGRMISPV
jgi:hypothetical protein